jgi:hypothetical protein
LDLYKAKALPSTKENANNKCSLQGLTARFNIARFEGPRRYPTAPLYKRKSSQKLQASRAESPIQYSEVRRASNHSPARFEEPRRYPPAPLHKRKSSQKLQPPRAESPIQHSEVRRASNHSPAPLYKRKSTQKLQASRAESPIQHSEVRRASDHSPARFEGPRIIPQLPSTKESPHKNCRLQGLKARFNIARF